MSVKILKKNCHQVLGSQKSKLTPPELVFQTAGAINPPPYKDRVKIQLIDLFICEYHDIIELSINWSNSNDDVESQSGC